MQQSVGRFLESIIADILKHNITADADTWLREKTALIREEKNAAQLNLTFAAVPRKTGGIWSI